MSSTTSGWQKLQPARSTSSLGLPQATTSRGELLYTTQHSSDGSISGGANSRSIPWPRNCARFLVYAMAMGLIVGMLGFFVGQRPLGQSTSLDEIIDDKAMMYEARQAGTNGDHLAQFPKPTLDQLLSKERIPNIVHYIWCETGYFEFKHFVSVQSAIKFIKPDLVVFHLSAEPQSDPLGYNDWWERLKRDTQNLIVHHVTDAPNCTGDAQQARALFDAHVRTQGGIYFASSGVVLSCALDLKLAADSQAVTFDYPTNNDSRRGLVTDLPALVLIKPNTDLAVIKTTEPKRCARSRDFDQQQDSSKTACLVVDDTESAPFYPRDIWEATNGFGKLVRAVAYDTEDILAPQPQPGALVPLICHYLWLGGGTIDFLLYLSILSCLHVLKADSVLIHGESEPKGALWKELLAMGDPRLSYVYRPQQETMYGTPVKKLAAMSDVLRTDILLKYGGIYTDWDAIWVRPLDAEIRSYEAVVAPDWPAKLKPFPATLNLGVMLAKPGSSYVKHLQEGMADYADGVGPLEWCFICLRAYKVLEKYPQTAKFEPHLQVMGYLGKYHPIWQAGAGEDSYDGKFDWRTETYAVHWTFPTPRELRSKAFLDKTNSTAADIARFVLKSSGLNE